MSKRKFHNCRSSCTLCSTGLKLRTCTIPLGVDGFIEATNDQLSGELTRINKRIKLIKDTYEIIMLTHNVDLIEIELKKRKLI